jgi:hypothetical protein
MTNPVAHKTADQAAWRKTWSTDRKKQALAEGAENVTETNLTVTHNVKHPDKFAEHVKKMQDAGKRDEMGAQNSPL